MSVSIQTVEFERRDAYLSALEEGPPYTVHGVALGADDVTVGQSGIKKLWPADELERAADSLEGRSLVVDHNNGSDGVVGTVTKAGYKENTGVIYEAELFDDDLAEKINNGLLEVSIRGKHSDVEQMEETDDGAKVVEDITFDNLSIVPTGAAPSNTIEVGEADELSMAELSSFTSQLAETELQEVEPGMWVKWGDNRGITISTVEDGEVEVDIYKEQDGQWRSTEETTMASTDDLSEWDVDEDDVGPVENDDESEEDEEASPFNYTDEMQGISSVPDNLRFVSKEDAMAFIEDENMLTGIHEMDGEYVPGANHDEFIEWVRAQEEADISDDPMDSNDVLEEMAAEGDKVQWDSSGGMARGVIVDRQTEGCFNDEIDGDVEVCAEEGDPALLIAIVDRESEGDKFQRTGTMVAHKESTVEETDFSMLAAIDAPEWSDGDMVHWQVNPEMMGKIVHVDNEKQIVMVEVMEEEGGEVVSSGFTVTAGFSDIEPQDGGEEPRESEEMAEERFDDYPEAASENAQMALDAREETDNPNDCGTDVGWKRANQLANDEGITREQLGKMSAFNRHRSNSEMDDDEGKADCGWMMWKAWGGDEGVDWAQEKLDSLEEEASKHKMDPDMEDDKESEAMPAEGDIPMPEDVHLLYPSEEKAQAAAEELGIEGSHSHTLDGDEWYMPGETHEAFIERMMSVAKGNDALGGAFQEAEMALAKYMDSKSDDEEDEEEMRTEGEERPITSDADKKRNREQSPERFIDEDIEELQAIHEPEWDSAEDKEWNAPDLEDFTDESWEDLSGDEREAIANHFIVSKTGEFPPERFSDLALPVVEPDGTLNLNALANAKARAGQVETVSEEDEEAISNMIDGLANDNFEDATFGEEEAGAYGERPRTVDDTGDEPGVRDERDRMPQGEASSVNVLTGDDLRRMSGKSEESELDDITTKVTNMTDDIEQKLAELSEPVAVEQDDLEELQQKADRFEEMSDTLEALKERTDVLDDVDREQVDELAEADEPVVVESARMESLEAEAEQVAETYASELAEELGMFSAEELTDKFSIEELREKYEEQIGDPAEELATSEDSEPQSGDVEEEELESRAGEGTEEEELSSESDEAEEMRDELRNKILG